MAYQLTAVALASCLCLGWTRLSGKVKIINLRDSSVTIMTRDGDLLTIPYDYQVKIFEKHGEMRELKNLALDEKITLINTPADKPKDESFQEMNGPK